MCGVTRVYPPSIFRSRKLRLAALIVGLQGFYFIPGPRNPTIKVAKRYFGDHFRVHLLITNKKTDAIDFSNARTEVALRAKINIEQWSRNRGLKVCRMLVGENSILNFRSLNKM